MKAKEFKQIAKENGVLIGKIKSYKRGDHKGYLVTHFTILNETTTSSDYTSDFFNMNLEQIAKEWFNL